MVVLNIPKLIGEEKFLERVMALRTSEYDGAGSCLLSPRLIHIYNRVDRIKFVSLWTAILMGISSRWQVTMVSRLIFFHYHTASMLFIASIPIFASVISFM